MQSSGCRLNAPRPAYFNRVVAPPATLQEWASAPGAGSVRNACELIHDSSTPVLLTGAAGTGKSHFVSLYRAETSMRTVVLASTGIAALQVGGQTVHSYFRLPPRVLYARDATPGDRWPLYAAMEAMILDEISMLRADAVDAIDLTLRRARQSGAPFGGVHVLFVGDPFQLAPIASGPEALVLSRRGYESPWFFHAKVFREVPLRIAELDQIHRQTDPAFAHLLSRVRPGLLSERDRAFLAECVRRGRSGLDPALILTATRSVAARENEARLESLGGNAVIYTGRIEGRFPSRDLPVPRELVLKLGARVMFVRNDPDRRWANGTTGTVVGCAHDELLVRTDSTERDVHRVGPAEWERMEYPRDSIGEQREPEVVGRYIQMPCVPGWAATVHKCQGMSLDRVRIDLGRGAFAAGQTYVALSRCRSSEGLELARPITSGDVWAHPAVVEFLAQAKREMRGRDAA